ncbi:MAG: sigma-70 family RNA polymerase sigma factor [Isosphaeraceae bacterium]
MPAPTPDSTCWTMIRAAADGSPADREELARRYLGVVRAYLAARWRGSALLDELDDATQAVFVECFRRGGVLDAAGAGRVPGFRAFLYGVVRNVAARFEDRPARAAGPLPDIEADEPTQSRLFDRAWAREIMAEAGRLQEARARDRGPEALRRVELLRLRFEENLPIREIAARWGADPAPLHHAYALARQEFRAALLEVVAFHLPDGTAAEREAEAAGLLKALS